MIRSIQCQVDIHYFLTLHFDIVGANIALRCGSNILLSKITKSRSIDRVGGRTTDGGKSDSSGKLHGYGLLEEQRSTSNERVGGLMKECC